ncbi:hypothetical protein LUZ63_006885 [Rhynchospora breviuscula]|uniref:Reverse transcriptase zinc-binding domain-containing protein n=1 Tax=Rhynchospora breviuscula TaxID=2022672 RepID=A0A9Q0CR07_9POAL|nr:hypothetical protein LUZ63_006885 [Rhynchospora breviuscula]
MINNLRRSHQNFLSTTTDIPVWKLSKPSGSFSTNSIYHFIKSHPTHSSHLSKIWSFKIPPRFQIFTWRMLQNKIATLDNLHRRGWSLPNRCVLCTCCSETAVHLFSQCHFYLRLRSLVQNNSTLRPHSADSQFPENPMALVQRRDVADKTKDIWAITFFILWKERCARMFSETSKHPASLLQEILSECCIPQQQHTLKSQFYSLMI